MLRFPFPLLVVFFNTFSVLFCSMLGPVDVIYKRMENCDPPINTIDFWVTQWKVNRSTENMNITLNTPRPIDEMVMMKLNGSMKKEGGWKPGAMYYEDQACRMLESMLGDTFHDVLEKTGNENCPLPAGNYNISNYYFDNSQFRVHQLYGEYRLEVTLYHLSEDGNPVVDGCYIIYYNFEAKDPAFGA